MAQIITPKIISDPIWGIFDIKPVQPIIDTQQFQALNFKYQLGTTWLIFPEATHTRKAHSLGTYEATKRLTQRLLILGLINKNEAKAIDVYGLIHDIGHGPLSHASEPLCPASNSAMGLLMIDELKSQIEKCDVDFNLVKDIFAGKNPLRSLVSGKNIGTEKIDYLRRDGWHTGFGEPGSTNLLQLHTYFVNGEVMIDKKAVNSALELLLFYATMYKEVYLRKESAIAQRMIQKMIHKLIKKNKLTPAALARLKDYQLFTALENSKDKTIRFLYSIFTAHDTMKETIVICYQHYLSTYSIGDKPIKLFGVDENFDPTKETNDFANSLMQKLINSQKINVKNPETLLQIENAIAKIAKIPEDKILVVPITSPDRFEAADVKIYKADKTLKELYPSHFQTINDIGHAYITLKVCTTNEYRKKLSSPSIAKKVYEYLINCA